MLTDALLEELRYKGEGSDLDYKSERYPFAKASDEEKSEILKDILALANTHRDGTAHILMGFKERPPEPAEAVGLSPEGAIDYSRLQEFVNGNLETKLTFRYEERLFDGKHIAAISIPKQQRPFYLKKDYGKLTKDTDYVRRGSSTIRVRSESDRASAQTIVAFHPWRITPLYDHHDRCKIQNFRRQQRGQGMLSNKPVKPLLSILDLFVSLA